MGTGSSVGVSSLSQPGKATCGMAASLSEPGSGACAASCPTGSTPCSWGAPRLIWQVCVEAGGAVAPWWLCLSMYAMVGFRELRGSSGTRSTCFLAGHLRDFHSAHLKYALRTPTGHIVVVCASHDLSPQRTRTSSLKRCALPSLFFFYCVLIFKCSCSLN